MKNISKEKLLDLKRKLVALSLGGVMTLSAGGCCSESHEDKINELNNTISDLNDQKTALETSNKELQNKIIELTATPTPAPTSAPTATPTPAPTSVANGYSRISKESKERSNRIKNAKSVKEEMYSIYDYISAEFIGENGQTYCWVSIPYDDDYYNGLFNMSTLNEDIPCMTYDDIGDEFKSENGQIYRRVSRFDDYGYSNGFFNMNTLKEDIPCMTYDFIDYYEFKGENGQIYRMVSVPNDDNYANGFFNMSTLNEDIPCKTYKSINDVGNGIYQCVKDDGTIKTLNLKK